MKKLIIMLGDYGSGKTGYGKYLAELNNGWIIDHDKLRYHPPVNFQDFLLRLKNVVDRNDLEYYVLDGWAESPPQYEKLASLNCEVEFYLCFAAPHIIQQRQALKSAVGIHDTVPKTYLEIVDSTLKISKELADQPYPVRYADTTEHNLTEVLTTKQEFIDRFKARQLETKLVHRPHDRYYQDIDLPGLFISGYSNSRETWKRLQTILEFKDKSVQDIGCFHGYFLFQAEKAGAKKLIGIDASHPAIDTANDIKAVTGSKAEFYPESIENYDMPVEITDITLCLNMLHHVSDISKAMQNIWLTGAEIVFEINNDQQEMLDNYAGQYGLIKTNVLNSHRLGRRIVKYQNPELFDYTGRVYRILPTPEKYRYNPLKEKTRGYMYAVYRKIKGLPVIGRLASAALALVYYRYFQKVKAE